MYEMIMNLPFNGFQVKGILSLPVKAKSIIIFSHGAGSSRLNPHEQALAHTFQQAGFGTLVFDLLEQEESPHDNQNIHLLSRGLLTSTNWLHGHSEYKDLNLAYFGSGSGAATVIKAAAGLGLVIKAVVCLSGRLELVADQIEDVISPTLLVVGELDFELVKINQQALKHLKGEKQIAVVPGASHLFEEPGKVENVGRIAVSWLQKHLQQEALDKEFKV